jgi:peptidoglycan/LPS O-acetylase OafA/YrhL
MGESVNDASGLAGRREAVRLHELDSLRALAAIGVAARHYCGHFDVMPLPWLMAPLYRNGELLVDFFFVLSGFVLARAYWNDRRSVTFAKNARERIARMYPLHLVTLCAVAVMQWMLVNPLNSPPFIYVFNDAYHFALNLFLANRTGLERGLSFNGPAWSISTEFVVNILFLAAIALPRNILRMVLVALFALLLALALKGGPIGGAAAAGTIQDMFRTVFGFCCGVALHQIHSQWSPRVNLNRGVADGLAIGAACALCGYIGIKDGELSWPIHVAIVATCFPALIVGAMHGGMVRWALTLPPLVYLGTISYSIYLVHFPMELALHLTSVALLVQMPYGSVLFMAGFFLVVIAMASITYYLVEVPGKKLLRARPMPVLGQPLGQPLESGNRK